MNPGQEAATEAMRRALAILGRASLTWHNGDPTDSGPLHWPVAVSVARRELRQAPGTMEGQPDERAQDARAGIAWWNHLTPTQRNYWLTQAQSSVPADAWEAFKSGETKRGAPSL
jgi:hypothetical protein